MEHKKGEKEWLTTLKLQTKRNQRDRENATYMPAAQIRLIHAADENAKKYYETYGCDWGPIAVGFRALLFPHIFSTKTPAIYTKLIGEATRELHLQQTLKNVLDGLDGSAPVMRERLKKGLLPSFVETPESGWFLSVAMDGLLRIVDMIHDSFGKYFENLQAFKLYEKTRGADLGFLPLRPSDGLRPLAQDIPPEEFNLYTSFLGDLLAAKKNISKYLDEENMQCWSVEPVLSLLPDLANADGPFLKGEYLVAMQKLGLFMRLQYISGADMTLDPAKVPAEVTKRYFTQKEAVCCSSQAKSGPGLRSLCRKMMKDDNVQCDDCRRNWQDREWCPYVVSKEDALVTGGLHGLVVTHPETMFGGKKGKKEWSGSEDEDNEEGQEISSKWEYMTPCDEPGCSCLLKPEETTIDDAMDFLAAFDKKKHSFLAAYKYATLCLIPGMGYYHPSPTAVCLRIWDHLSGSLSNRICTAKSHRDQDSKTTAAGVVKRLLEDARRYGRCYTHHQFGVFQLYCLLMEYAYLAFVIRRQILRQIDSGHSLVHLICYFNELPDNLMLQTLQVMFFDLVTFWKANKAFNFDEKLKSLTGPKQDLAERMAGFWELSMDKDDEEGKGSEKEKPNGGKKKGKGKKKQKKKNKQKAARESGGGDADHGTESDAQLPGKREGESDHKVSNAKRRNSETIYSPKDYWSYRRRSDSVLFVADSSYLGFAGCYPDVRARIVRSGLQESGKGLWEYINARMSDICALLTLDERPVDIFPGEIGFDGAFFSEKHPETDKSLKEALAVVKSLNNAQKSRGGGPLTRDEIRKIAGTRLECVKMPEEGNVEATPVVPAGLTFNKSPADSEFVVEWDERPVECPATSTAATLSTCPEAAVQFLESMDIHKLMTWFKLSTFCLLSRSAQMGPPPAELISAATRALFHKLLAERVLGWHFEARDISLHLNHSSTLGRKHSHSDDHVRHYWVPLLELALVFHNFRKSLLDYVESDVATPSFVPLVAYFNQNYDNPSSTLITCLFWDMVNFAQANDQFDPTAVLQNLVGSESNVSIAERVEQLAALADDMPAALKPQNICSYVAYGNRAIMFSEKYDFKKIMTDKCWEKLRKGAVGIPTSETQWFAWQADLCALLWLYEPPGNLFPGEYGHDREVFDRKGYRSRFTSNKTFKDALMEPENLATAMADQKPIGLVCPPSVLILPQTTYFRKQSLARLAATHEAIAAGWSDSDRANLEPDFKEWMIAARSMIPNPNPAKSATKMEPGETSKAQTAKNDQGQGTPENESRDNSVGPETTDKKGKKKRPARSRSNSLAPGSDHQSLAFSAVDAYNSGNLKLAAELFSLVAASDDRPIRLAANVSSAHSWLAVNDDSLLDKASDAIGKVESDLIGEQFPAHKYLAALMNLRKLDYAAAEANITALEGDINDNFEPLRFPFSNEFIPFSTPGFLRDQIPSLIKRLEDRKEPDFVCWQKSCDDPNFYKSLSGRFAELKCSGGENFKFHEKCVKVEAKQRNFDINDIMTDEVGIDCLTPDCGALIECTIYNEPNATKLVKKQVIRTKPVLNKNANEAGPSSQSEGAGPLKKQRQPSAGKRKPYVGRGSTGSVSSGGSRSRHASSEESRSRHNSGEEKPLSTRLSRFLDEFHRTLRSSTPQDVALRYDDDSVQALVQAAGDLCVEMSEPDGLETVMRKRPDLFVCFPSFFRLASCSEPSSGRTTPSPGPSRHRHASDRDVNQRRQSGDVCRRRPTSGDTAVPDPSPPPVLRYAAKLRLDLPVNPLTPPIEVSAEPGRCNDGRPWFPTADNAQAGGDRPMPDSCELATPDDIQSNSCSEATLKPDPSQTQRCDPAAPDQFLKVDRSHDARTPSPDHHGEVPEVSPRKRHASSPVLRSSLGTWRRSVETLIGDSSDEPRFLLSRQNTVVTSPSEAQAGQHDLSDILMSLTVSDLPSEPPSPQRPTQLDHNFRPQSEPQRPSTSKDVPSAVLPQGQGPQVGAIPSDQGFYGNQPAGQPQRFPAFHPNAQNYRPTQFYPGATIAPQFYDGAAYAQDVHGRQHAAVWNQAQGRQVQYFHGCGIQGMMPQWQQGQCVPFTRSTFQYHQGFPQPVAPYQYQGQRPFLQQQQMPVQYHPTFVPNVQHQQQPMPQHYNVQNAGQQFLSNVQHRPVAMNVGFDRQNAFGIGTNPNAPNANLETLQAYAPSGHTPNLNAYAQPQPQPQPLTGINFYQGYHVREPSAVNTYVNRPGSTSLGWNGLGQNDAWVTQGDMTEGWTNAPSRDGNEAWRYANDTAFVRSSNSRDSNVWMPDTSPTGVGPTVTYPPSPPPSVDRWSMPEKVDGATASADPGTSEKTENLVGPRTEAVERPVDQSPPVSGATIDSETQKRDNQPMSKPTQGRWCPNLDGEDAWTRGITDPSALAWEPSSIDLARPPGLEPTNCMAAPGLSMPFTANRTAALTRSKAVVPNTTPAETNQYLAAAPPTVGSAGAPSTEKKNRKPAKLTKGPPPGFEIDICHICSKTIQPGDIKSTMMCGHTFHEECVVVWSIEGGKCPVCQADLIGNVASLRK